MIENAFFLKNFLTTKGIYGKLTKPSKNGKNITKKFKKVLTYRLFCDNIEKLSDGTAVGH